MEENQAHWSRVSLEHFRQFGLGFLKNKFSSQLQDWVVHLLTPDESVVMGFLSLERFHNKPA